MENVGSNTPVKLRYSHELLPSTQNAEFQWENLRFQFISAINFGCSHNSSGN